MRSAVRCIELHRKRHKLKQNSERKQRIPRSIKNVPVLLVKNNPIKINGHASVEPRFATGTIAERSVSGTIPCWCWNGMSALMRRHTDSCHRRASIHRIRQIQRLVRRIVVIGQIARYMLQSTRRRFLPSARSVPPPVLRSCRTCCGRKYYLAGRLHPRRCNQTDDCSDEHEYIRRIKSPSNSMNMA